MLNHILVLVATSKLDEKSLIGQNHNFMDYIYIYIYIIFLVKILRDSISKKKTNIPCKYILDNYIPLLL